MNKRLTRTAWAARLATGLLDTSRRYSLGLMSHGTWKAHMRALWDVVDARGMRRDVCKALGINPSSPTRGAIR